MFRTYHRLYTAFDDIIPVLCCRQEAVSGPLQSFRGLFGVWSSQARVCHHSRAVRLSWQRPPTRPPSFRCPRPAAFCYVRNIPSKHAPTTAETACDRCTAPAR